MRLSRSAIFLSAVIAAVPCLLAPGGRVRAAGPEAAKSATAAREAAWRENNLGVALLEQFRFADAVPVFERALQKDPTLLAARVNLAIAHLYVPDIPSAKAAAEDALRSAPDVPHLNYILALIARTEGRAEEALPYLEKLLAQDPKDLGANVTLGQVHLQLRDYAKAAEAFRIATQAEPYNVSAAYNLGVALTRSGQREEGQVAMQRFQKLRDSAYKSALGSNYLEQGKYAEAIASTGAEPETVDSVPPAIVFAAKEVPAGSRPKAAASSLGHRPAAPEAASALPRAAMVLADLDADGTLDAVLAGLPSLVVLRNAKGVFTDVTRELGLANVPALLVLPGDYDNDGRNDLLVVKPSGLALFRNGGSRFEDVTAAAKLPPFPYVSASAAWVDIDHDGDVDLFVAGLADLAVAPQGNEAAFPDGWAPAPSLLLQNNGDGTFTDITATAQVGDPSRTLAVIPTDFDNRRDVDLFVLRRDAVVLFKNMRDGSFRDLAGELGLVARGPFLSAAAGDPNKDGYTDFFLGGERSSWLAMSDGKGAFVTSAAPAAVAGALAAQFVDYDNDGLLDLLAVTAQGPRLLRNLGASWADLSQAAFGAAAADLSGAALTVADLEGDGDADLLVATARRLVSFVNDGGHRNRSIAVLPIGRVSNKGAVGAKIDIRAGSLRQKLEVSAAVPMAAPADLVFGLGQRQAPDAVRVIWVSGIVQTETEFGSQPPSGQRAALLVNELDRKPSSCPYLYAWNGSRFEFITDFLGAGEMGYYHAPGVWSLPDPVEYVRLGPGQLAPKDGRYELRVTNELEEVLYLDRLRLLAIDHPDDVLVFPDEGMTDPPKPFRLVAVRDPRSARVRDHQGRDVTERLARRDRVFADELPLERIRGYAKEHALTFDLAALPVRHEVLLLTGWTDYAFSSDNVAGHQAGLALLPPRLEAEQADGSWKTVIEQIGVPVGRPQTVVVDLAGKLGPSRRARIVTSMRIYWDEALVAEPAADVELEPRALEPQRVVLRERGFSRENSPDGREPWTFEYASVSPLSPWKTMPGLYTRTGDVRPLLVAADDTFVISKPGDEVALSFDAAGLGGPAAGWARTFLVHSDGYSKEMDINSASPDVVQPLPYRGMTRYPYPESDAPDHVRAAWREMEAWNTRPVVRPITPIELHAENR